jgi:tocopherol O-methyltransferase
MDNTGITPIFTESSSVGSYYLSKTAHIIDRYGPGPRISYHLGFLSGSPSTSATTEEIRKGIVVGQTRYLDHCAQAWDAATVFTGRVLDVGCGLGGPSIYWAQRYGAHVTAVTIVPEHAPLVAEFARQAEVEHLVEPLVADFTRLSSVAAFAAVVSMEAICYMDRHAVFSRAAEALPTGGFVCVEDVFLGKTSGKQPFDAYWTTDIAPMREYEQAARSCGFALDRNEDVTEATANLWVWSTAWAEARLRESAERDELTGEAEMKLLRSIREHARLFRCFQDRVYEARILRFQKTGL